MGSRLIALVLALVLSGLAGGCGASMGGLVPSPACGGFGLTIRNTGIVAVLIYVNGKELTPLNGGATIVVSEWGAPSAGLLPWTVEIANAATGVNIATRQVTEASGDGAATLDVKVPSGGAPTVSDVQSAKGC